MNQGPIRQWGFETPLLLHKQPQHWVQCIAPGFMTAITDCACAIGLHSSSANSTSSFCSQHGQHQSLQVHTILRNSPSAVAVRNAVPTDLACLRNNAMLCSSQMYSITLCMHMVGVYRTEFQYCCNQYIVAFAITIGNSILHCVSAVVTAVAMVLRKQVSNLLTMLKFGTLLHACDATHLQLKLPRWQ